METRRRVISGTQAIERRKNNLVKFKAYNGGKYERERESLSPFLNAYWKKTRENNPYRPPIFFKEKDSINHIMWNMIDKTIREYELARMELPKETVPNSRLLDVLMGRFELFQHFFCEGYSEEEKYTYSPYTTRKYLFQIKSLFLDTIDQEIEQLQVSTLNNQYKTIQKLQIARQEILNVVKEELQPFFLMSASEMLVAAKAQSPINLADARLKPQQERIILRKLHIKLMVLLKSYSNRKELIGNSNSIEKFLTLLTKFKNTFVVCWKEISAEEYPLISQYKTEKIKLLSHPLLRINVNVNQKVRAIINETDELAKQKNINYEELTRSLKITRMALNNKNNKAGGSQLINQAKKIRFYRWEILSVLMMTLGALIFAGGFLFAKATLPTGVGAVGGYIIAGLGALTFFAGAALLKKKCEERGLSKSMNRLGQAMLKM